MIATLTVFLKCSSNEFLEFCFVFTFKKSYVFQWDGQENTRWQQVNCVRIELPADTLIEAEFVQELKGEVI